MTIQKPSPYQGDPKIYIDENGADLRFVGGQPVMDAGLENSATISLFTDLGWWGNDLVTADAEKIGSEFESIASQPITSTSFADTESAAADALAWYTSIGLAESVDVEASNPSARKVAVTVQIVPPAGDTLILQSIKNGINWINQKLDPASEK